MFVEIQRGRSFGGLARYCLHDEGRAASSYRVEFAVVRNMATGNPHVAWRVMCAKHYEQPRLKAEHGVRVQERPDSKPVGHLLLSWRKDEAEAEGLNQEKMLKAADGALRAIGAAGHEAIVVAHNDKQHPHLHVIL